MKHYLLLLIIATGMVGCEHGILSLDIDSEGYDSKKVICVAPNAELISDDTRGTPITTISQMTNIGVYCSYTASSDWNNTTSNLGKMFNTTLTRNSLNGNWEYSTTPMNWGASNGNDRYSFFAYAPFASATNGIVVEGNSSTVGIPSVTYTAPVDVVQQPDLMLAAPRYNLRPTSGLVSLQMKHALTSVGFQVQGDGEKIKSIAISGVLTKGKAKVDGGNIVWDLSNQPSSLTDFIPTINYDLGQSYYTATTTMSTNLIPGSGYLMMVPQTLGANAKLIITFSDDKKREMSLNNQVWEAGKKITYNIIITPNGIITVTPSVMYISSLGVTYQTDNLQLICDPVDLDWSLSTTATWFRMTLDSNGTNPTNSVVGKGAATIYTVVDANVLTSDRATTIYAQNRPTNVVVNVIQFKPTNLVSVENGGDVMVGATPYVGAFWRDSQTGERIIRIPVGNNVQNSGTWSASVEWMDSGWSAGDINLSTTTSLDPNVSHIQNMTPGDAESYKVLEKQTLVTGTVAANGNVYFRIGLNSAFTATTAKPARYAVIVLRYGNMLRTRMIFLRQGHEADYLMRDIDPAIGSYVNPTRPKACKISPFNLRPPRSVVWVGGSNLLNLPTLLPFGGDFTEYPTQAGAFFQWASLTFPRMAFHPIDPESSILNWPISISSAFWDESVLGVVLSAIHETCPAGYRRVNDGSETAKSNLLSASSELRQSFLYTLADGVFNAPKNAVGGYYADGFFDRRFILTSYNNSTDPTTVSYYSPASDLRNSEVAYIGTLYYNPITAASVFLPSSGMRGLDGGLEQSGTTGTYWTSSSVNDAICLKTGIGYLGMFGTEIRRSIGANIRCVK